MVGQASDHRGDALVEERHGRGTVDEVGERVHQLLPQTRLQRHQCSELEEGIEGDDRKKCIWSEHLLIKHLGNEMK